MKPPLQIISSLGCSTTSYLSAIQTLAPLTFDKHQYEKYIADILGLSEPTTVASLFEARTLFLYVIQETIRAYQTTSIPLMDEIYITSIERTKRYLNECPWARTQFNIEHGIQSIENTDSEATSMQKKGGKKEISEGIFKEMKANGSSRKEILKAFVEQLGMSKAGATTYFHTLKNTYGFTENKQVSKLKSYTKQQIAEQVYEQTDDKTKQNIIKIFMEKLNTSKLGAQTYYYSCKKKDESSNLTP